MASRGERNQFFKSIFTLSNLIKVPQNFRAVLSLHGSGYEGTLKPECGELGGRSLTCQKILIRVQIRTFQVYLFLAQNNSLLIRGRLCRRGNADKARYEVLALEWFHLIWFLATKLFLIVPRYLIDDCFH